MCSQDGKVDLFDIVFVINGWTGSAGCEMTAAPFIDGWTVETEPQSAPLCPGNDVTLRTTISFTNLAPLENFIVQADAPFEGATIQSVTLVATGQSSWSSSNCVIYTSAGYSYFTCENGGDIKDGDTFVLSYTLRSLGTRVGFFTSEVTTFPPVQIAQGVILDMFCGSTGNIFLFSIIEYRLSIIARNCSPNSSFLISSSSHDNCYSHNNTCASVRVVAFNHWSGANLRRSDLDVHSYSGRGERFWVSISCWIKFYSRRRLGVSESSCILERNRV